jgi:hypothetical protein
MQNSSVMIRLHVKRDTLPDLERVEQAQAVMWQKIKAALNSTSVTLDSAGAGKTALKKQPANAHARWGPQP